MNQHPVKWEQLKRAVDDVSRETFERRLAYEQLFFKWNKAFNLAAPSTLSEFWPRHVVDSAQLARLHTMNRTWVDVGSGGGLPGIVMAILRMETETEPIHLVESNGKKAAFLRTALTETGAKGIVHNKRIEDAVNVIEMPDVVTARALASLNDLFGLTSGWLTGKTVGLFHKGRDFQREIDQARGGWVFDLIEHPSVVTVDSVILEISNLRQLA